MGFLRTVSKEQKKEKLKWVSVNLSGNRGRPFVSLALGMLKPERIEMNVMKWIRNMG